MDRIPNLNEALQYSVQRIGEAEGIRQSLYDFQLYPTAGATTFAFFQTPQGAGLSSHPGFANQTKTIADTNMEAAGSLPSPKSFLIESIEIKFMPGSVATANTYTPQVMYSFIAVPTAAVPAAAHAVNDYNFVLQGGELQLFIMSKSYLDEAPLDRFPPKTQFSVDAAMATNSATTGTIAIASAKVTGRPYFMDPPILLMATQNFKVSLNWPVAQATPSGFNARIGVVLDGFLYRNSQ